MSNGYICIPRSLLQDPFWISLPLTYKMVFYKIIELSCFRPRQFCDNGVLLDLQIGQVCISERRLAKECGPEFCKSLIHRCLLRFKYVSFSDHSVNHNKLIITITHIDTYNLIKNASESTIEPRSDQLRTTKEEVKKRRSIKKEKYKKENPPIDKKQPSAKIAYREFVTLTPQEYSNLLALHRQDKLDRMLDILNSYKGRSGKIYLSDYHAMSAGSWVLREAEVENKPTQTVSEANLKLVSQAIIELKSPVCELKLEGNIIFFIPTLGQAAPISLKVSDLGFKEQFLNNLRKRQFTKST